MVESREKKSSGVAKAGLATAIGAGVVALANGCGLGGVVPSIGLRGGYAPVAATTAAAETAVILPMITALMNGAGRGHGDHDNLVSDKDLNFVRELSSKDAIIGQLTAEKYADKAVAEAKADTDRKIDAANARICELEKAAAVNKTRDNDFRRYVDAEFIHQPKASIRKSIVVCKTCGCRCDCECETDAE